MPNTNTNTKFLEESKKLQAQADKDIKAIMDNNEYTPEKRGELVQEVNSKLEADLKILEKECTIPEDVEETSKVVNIKESEKLQAKGWQVIGISMEDGVKVHKLVPPPKDVKE